ncbi:MAG TPA: hypothetical protein VG733_20060 [Chthoniobacteraceae bacterium]|nr:hypothetical protein [Chthoniobacteraceae bacterium]
MIQERLDEIQTKVQGASNIPDETKGQLLALIADLKREVGALAATHNEQAQAIAHYTDVTTREATRPDKQPGELDAAIEELTASVGGFESTHPKLTEIVNRLAVTFSGVGI